MTIDYRNALVTCALAMSLSVFVPTASAAADDYVLPVVMPPFHLATVPTATPAWGTCMFYMETITINVITTKDDAKQKGGGATIGNSTKNTWHWNNDYINCLPISCNKTSTPKAPEDKNKKWQPQTFNFTIDMTLAEPVKANASSGDKGALFSLDGNIKLTLHFTTVPGYSWQLYDVTTDGFTIKKGDVTEFMSEDLKVAKSNATMQSVNYMNFGAHNGYNFACSKTRVAVLTPVDQKSNDNDKPQYMVAVGFGNIQVQASCIGKRKPKDGENGDKPIFTHLTEDCIGTFTEGSWMGIIVTLVLISVMMFGFLMLNSVKTVDRFDDPKQKQLIINAKE